MVFLWMLRAEAADLPESSMPELEASWSRAGVELRFIPPAGEHFAPDSPARFTAAQGGPSWTIETTGAGLADGWHGTGVGTWIVGLDAVVCRDDGVECRPVVAAYTLATAGGKGKATVAGTPPRERAPIARPVVTDLGPALAEAQDTQRLLLVDVGAVWCPPCNQLKAEILENRDQEKLLAPFVITTMDADLPSSWPVLDRYHIHAYPTVLLLRPDGTELDRMLGYGDAEGFIAWLSKAPRQTMALGDLPDPASVSPEQAIEVAFRLAGTDGPEGSRADARVWLARGEASADAASNVHLHEARLAVAPAVADALWLAKSPEAKLDDWCWMATDLAQENEELKGAMIVALEAEIATAAPLDAAGLLDVRADLADDASARALRAAAATLLAGAMTGNPALDRPHWGMLAYLYGEAGRQDEALKVLDEAVATYPEEFTWHFKRAKLLEKLGRLDDAAGSASLAVEFGFGDNRLRAVEVAARIEWARGHKDEARKLIDDTLALAQKPPAGSIAWTQTYLDALVTLEKSWTN